MNMFATAAADIYALTANGGHADQALDTLVFGVRDRDS